MTAAYFNSGATIEVSMAFGFAVNDIPADGDYTDVTAYVRSGIRIQRGRSSELDTFQVGTCTFELDNRDRRFDPNHASSPYVGDLVPNVHVRVRMTYGATTYWLFKGWVTGWPQSWDESNADAIVRITAHDWFKWAARCLLPESLFFYYVWNLLPTAWYRLGEQLDDPVMRDSGFYGRHGTYTTGQTTTASGLVELSGDGARELVVNPGATGNKLGTYVGGSAWSLAFWLKATGTPAATSAGDYFYRQDTVDAANPGNRPSLAIVYTKSFSQVLNISAQDETGGQLGWNYDASTLADGNRHYVAITATGTTWNLYVDGVAVSPTGTNTLAGTNYGTIAWLGGYTIENAGWVIDELSLYDFEMIPAAVLAQYVAGTTALAGDTVDVRLTNAYGIAGAPTVNPAGDICTTTVRGFDCGSGSTSLLAYGQSIERTVGLQARWFVAANGDVTFHDRYHDTLNTTVAAAFTDVAGTTLPYVEAEHEDDDTRIYNDVTIARENGTPQRAIDLTSRTTYGVSALSYTGLQGQSDEECYQLAWAHLAARKDPHQRFRSLTVKPRAAAATLFPIIGAVDIGSRVTLRRLPMATGAAFTQGLTVEGITHDISVKGEWTTTYLTAPTDAADAVGVWDSGLWDTAVWSV